MVKTGRKERNHDGYGKKEEKRRHRRRISIIGGKI